MPAKVQTPTTAPTPQPAASAPSTGPSLQPGGNEAAKDKLKSRPSGPAGRIWNRILGQAEGTDTGSATIDAKMLETYLDARLGFAEGEIFRGKKLSGAAASLVKQYDKDGDGRLTWAEFKSAEDLLYRMLAPAAADGKLDATRAAAAQHKAVGGADGQADLGEVQSMATSQLPPGTSYPDLVGQLGARLAIDAADKDERARPVGERALSKEEWTGAAKEIEAGRK
ncbi:MAG: hypothetical protein ACOZNI_27715 [Myxococcota bacterium]